MASKIHFWPDFLHLFSQLKMISNVGEKTDVTLAAQRRRGWQAPFGHDCFVRARHSHMAGAMWGGNIKKGGKKKKNIPKEYIFNQIAEPTGVLQEHPTPWRNIQLLFRLRGNRTDPLVRSNALTFPASTFLWQVSLRRRKMRTSQQRKKRVEAS